MQKQVLTLKIYTKMIHRPTHQTAYSTTKGAYLEA